MTQILEKSLVLGVSLSLLAAMFPVYQKGLETIERQNIHYISSFILNRIRQGVQFVSSSQITEYSCIFSIQGSLSIRSAGNEIVVEVVFGNTTRRLRESFEVPVFADAQVGPGVYVLRATRSGDAVAIGFEGVGE